MRGSENGRVRSLASRYIFRGHFATITQGRPKRKSFQFPFHCQGILIDGSHERWDPCHIFCPEYNIAMMTEISLYWGGQPEFPDSLGEQAEPER